MGPKKAATKKTERADDEQQSTEVAPKKIRSEPQDEPLLERKSSSRQAAVTEEDILKNTVPFVRKTADSDFKADSMIKFISWNVAGLRALLKKEDGKEFYAIFEKQRPDILCLQETKLSDKAESSKIGVVPGYTFVDSVSTAKKGYSGTRTYVRDGIDADHILGFDVLSSKPREDDEGRILSSLLFGGKLAIANSYVPNSGMTLERLGYRTTEYDPLVRKFLLDLNKKASGNVIWTGDLNVAERDYDRYFATNFKAMQKVPGFTPEERASFRTTLAETNMVDSFRHVYPNAAKAYSFWSAKFQSKQKGNGWRLDYFVVSANLVKRVVDSFMLPEYVASDHCPIVLWLQKQK